jgi:undecaprenyl-phosphate 4-deoxy-4-formamido-L-arabinose transferase
MAMNSARPHSKIPQDLLPLRQGVSVVVPVYNSERTLAQLVERLEPVLRLEGQSFEIILVNDGSRDRSWQVIQSLCSRFDSIRGVCLMRNFGQHNALLCGIRLASYDTIVTIDDDLQHPPEELPALLKKLAEGYDVVYGTPKQMRHGLLRNLASRITKLAMQKAMGAETASRIGAFRAFRTGLRHAFDGFNAPYVSVDVLLTWGGSRFTSQTVRHEPRVEGTSNYTFGKLAAHAVNMIAGFSVWPLRLASVIGFFFTLFGGGTLLYVVGRYLFQGTIVAGFPFLASLVSIFAGAQLFALGIMGEYMSRLYVRAMDRPAYSIGEYISCEIASSPAPDSVATDQR